MTKYNIWFFSSLLIALIVSLPIITVFFSFFNETSNYFTLLKNTFLFDYIFNSIIILFFVIVLTLILGVLSAYFVSFYEFPFSNFFSWILILAFAVPGYIYAFSIIAFFENYGTAFSILTYLFGENKSMIANFLLNNIEYEIFDNMEDAFDTAQFDGQKKHNITNIILSPMSSSLDQFQNFEERGLKFKEMCLKAIELQNAR